jgi:hypothetical protein
MPPHAFAVDGARLRYGCFAESDQSWETRAYREVALGEEAFIPGPLGGSLREPERLRAPLVELLGTLESEVSEASLVLPDSWLRLAVVEAERLPRAHKGREEILRWKLQQIVPFKVEDLRLRETELTQLPTRQGVQRVLIGFGLDQLLSQLEELFAEQGIRVGNLVNQSLGTLAAVGHNLQNVELGAIVLLSDDGYSLSFTYRGELLLHRHRALTGSSVAELPEGVVSRDLNLTRVYLEELLGSVSLERILVVGPAEAVAPWSQWLEASFGFPALPLEVQYLSLAGDLRGASLHRLTPVLGAAAQRIP